MKKNEGEAPRKKAMPTPSRKKWGKEHEKFSIKTFCL
jgi:hypothetical protein